MATCKHSGCDFGVPVPDRDIGLCNKHQDMLDEKGSSYTVAVLQEIPVDVIAEDEEEAKERAKDIVYDDHHPTPLYHEDVTQNVYEEGCL